MTLKEIYIYGKKILPDPFESLILCEELFGKTRNDIIMNSSLEIINPEIFLNAVKRRLNGEPLQYILGYWYFDEMKLSVGKDVLIPREDSLVLANCAKKFIGIKKMNGLDLCSGTGAIALSVAKNCPNATVQAVELFEKPLELLKQNVKTHGKSRVGIIKGDVFQIHTQHNSLDFIVSNPPYIESKEICNLQIEVQNEPHTALDGGMDGLDFYKVICEKWSLCLKKDGLLAVEIGETQAKEVEKLFLKNNFYNVQVLKDFNDLERVVFGYKVRPTHSSSDG